MTRTRGISPDDRSFLLDVVQRQDKSLGDSATVTIEGFKVPPNSNLLLCYFKTNNMKKITGGNIIVTYPNLATNLILTYPLGQALLAWWVPVLQSMKVVRKEFVGSSSFHLPLIQGFVSSRHAETTLRYSPLSPCSLAASILLPLQMSLT